MTERLDRIEASIEALNQSLNFLVTEFIRPNAQQTNANRLDLQALDERLEQVAAMQAEAAQQQAIIDRQLQANAEQSAANEQQIAANAEAIAALREASQESDTRFNILIQEMRSDRRATQQATRALLLAMANINADVSELGDRIESLEAS